LLCFVQVPKRIATFISTGRWRCNCAFNYFRCLLCACRRQQGFHPDRLLLSVGVVRGGHGTVSIVGCMVERLRTLLLKLSIGLLGIDRGGGCIVYAFVGRLRVDRSLLIRLLHLLLRVRLRHRLLLAVRLRVSLLLERISLLHLLLRIWLLLLLLLHRWVR